LASQKCIDRFSFQYLPTECTPVDDEDFYGDREAEIAWEKEKLRRISVEEGDSVIMEYIVSIRGYSTDYQG